MMKKNVLLTAALGLIISAVTAQAAPMEPATAKAGKSTIITALPFTIVTPGIYELASYLSGQFPSRAGTDITINVNVPGKVVLDLKGFTLIPYETSDHLSSFGYSEDAIDVLAGTDISIENGIIGTAAYSFGTAIYVNANATGPYGSGANPIPTGLNFLSGVTIKNVSFDNQLYDIVFNQVNLSTIKDCFFYLGNYGIFDTGSQYGNTYVNNSFVDMRYALTVASRFSQVLQRCRFTQPNP